MQTTLYRYLLGWGMVPRWIGTVVIGSTPPPRFCWNDATDKDIILVRTRRARSLNKNGENLSFIITSLFKVEVEIESDAMHCGKTRIQTTILHHRSATKWQGRRVEVKSAAEAERTWRKAAELNSPTTPPTSQNSANWPHHNCLQVALSFSHSV